MTATRVRARESALTAAQEERLARYDIDPEHVWWWGPHSGIDYNWVRAWRGISLVGLPREQPGLDPEDVDWDEDIACRTVYAIGHGLPADKVLEALAAHASWGHEKPRPLRPLTKDDLVEGWAEFLRHRIFGCPNRYNCDDEDSLYVFDAAPSDYLVVPVTRVSHPEAV
ncbi:hypothetical protein [Streptomyces sp. CC224B]|uniref:hypothetical protein n=1 Tax=Streptomyces sp. CC224B TaxID=3044571 RepID=UPI0024A88BBD|nr:hypothetical protein [Streptomyces sp. CC224B]